ncbi:MAG: hypothetical protein Q4C73_01510 [Eubacteriales bacterium]|nr:hypothetical protein [Eubacteriales bacterium]
MKIMNTERQLQAGLEAVGETISRYSYLQDALEKGDLLSVPGADDADRRLGSSLGKGVAAVYAQSRILSYIDTENLIGVNLLRSSIREDGEIIDLILDYEIRMPLPVPGLRSISRTIRCRRRAWIGKNGGDGESGTDGRGEGGDGGDRVYVGRYSTRYHTDKSCHYLSNNLTAVSFDSLSDRRNESGGKYHACSVCGAGAGSGGSVYIMPQGRHYHRTQNCSATIAYVQEVKKEQVEHLGPCSYCSH